MVGIPGRGKNNNPVVQGSDSFLHLSHLFIPQFKVSTILFFPILVKIYKHIQSPVQPIIRMFIEIHVDRKLPSGGNLVETTPLELRVADKFLGPRKILKKL
jgi:hypothetical protein